MGLINKQKVATLSGFSLQTRLYNSLWYLVMIEALNPDSFFVRGKNLLNRADVVINVPLSSADLAQIEGGDTLFEGLEQPVGFATPQGYTLKTKTDGAKFYEGEVKNATARKFKITKKDILPIGFATTAELMSGQGLDKFITSQELLPYLSFAFTNFYNQIAGDAPIQALDTLREIGDRLTVMGATDGSIQQMISEILGTKASLSYVDGKLVLKADLSMVQGSVADINARIQTEVALRTSEVARVEAIANAKITEERLLYISNEYYQLANARLLTVENTTIPAINEAIVKKSSKVELQAEVTARTGEVARVQAIADSKTTNEHLEVRIAEVLNYENNRDVNTRADLVAVATNKANDAFTNAKADSRGYTDNHILNLNQNILPLLESKAEANASIALLNAAIATKTTNQDVNENVAYWKLHDLTPTYKGIVDALRAEMLAIEGIDETEFTRLRDLLAQLTALESADVAGLNASISQKIGKNGIISEDFLKIRYDLTDPFAFITNESLMVREDSEVFGGRAMTHFLRKMYKQAETKVAKDHILDGTKVGTLENFMSDLATIQGNLGAVLNAERIQSFFLQAYDKINAKVAKADVLDGSIFPSSASLFATYITPDARLTKDKYFNALNLRQFLADLSNYTDTVSATKFAKDHVLKLDTVQGMWHFINDMTIQELEDKVVDANVLRILINDLFGHLNTKANTADAFAKDHVLNSTWSTATLGSWLAYIDATDAQIGSGKVVDAQILRNILREVVNHANTKVAGTKVAKSSWITPNQVHSIGEFLDESSLNSDHVFSAELTQALFKILNVKVDTKVNENKIVADSWANELFQTNGSGNIVMSGLLDTDLDNSQLMSARLALKLFKMGFQHSQEKASNARVQLLEEEVAQLRADFDSLTDPQ